MNYKTPIISSPTLMENEKKVMMRKLYWLPMNRFEARCNKDKLRGKSFGSVPGRRFLYNDNFNNLVIFLKENGKPTSEL
jgi:hypothetical protein